MTRLAVRDELRGRLLESGRLVATGVDGVYGRDERFERVVAAISGAVRQLGAKDNPTRVDFPPVLPRTTFEAIGYIRSFPHLCGVVSSFRGDDRDHAAFLRRLDDGEPYRDALDLAEVTLTPAACYPLYPTLPSALSADGMTLETCVYCFRHEPSADPMRMQAFRQHEHVRVGTPEDVDAFRLTWLTRAGALLADLGLEVRREFANDAFFGRAGRLMKLSQRDLELKTEFQIVLDESYVTACASVNCHLDRFGELFEIRTPDGTAAHSACVGFGLERCAIALLAVHGMDVEEWPPAVRARLWG